MTRETNWICFHKFHRDNPHIYDYLRQLALQVKAKGYDKFGLNTIWERMRWNYEIDAIETYDPHREYKLDSRFVAFYARLLMKNEPDLENFFYLRRSVADRDNVVGNIPYEGIVDDSYDALVDEADNEISIEEGICESV